MKSLTILTLALALAACGESPGTRAVTGGLLAPEPERRSAA